MKNLKRIIVAIVAIAAIAAPASAQFRIGLKGGVDLTSLSTENIAGNFKLENRTGYTLGLTSEFTVPLIGLGFDLGVMYVHRNTDIDNAGGAVDQVIGNTVDALFNDEDYRKKDYIEIPLNLKYKLSLPIVGEFIKPYVTTGPSIAFKCSKAAVTSAYKEKNFDAAWNLGGGVELVKHLQVGVNYSWGLTNTIESKVGITPVDIKNNGWKVTAAYYF